MMTRAEQAKMRRLEAENAQLRERLARQLAIYTDMSWEIVALRTAAQTIQDALTAAREVVENG